MVTLFYWQLMITKWAIWNLSINLPCSPSIGQFQSSQNLNSEVTSYEFYDNLGAHFFRIFDEKTSTEVVAVLTILNVWVICLLVLIQLYQSPTRQTHWKIPYYALSRKITLENYREKSLFLVKISSNIMQFLPKSSNQKLTSDILFFYSKCSYIFHLAKKEKKYR